MYLLEQFCHPSLNNSTTVHCGSPMYKIEVSKHFCTSLAGLITCFVHCCIGFFCTERYGNLTKQSLFFPVNGPFYALVCVWTFKIQNYRFCTLHLSDQILYRALLEFAYFFAKKETKHIYRAFQRH